MDALKIFMIIRFTPYKTITLPKWMFSQQIFVQIILAAKQSVRQSSTSPKQQRRPLPALLSLSFFNDQVPAEGLPLSALELPETGGTSYNPPPLPPSGRQQTFLSNQKLNLMEDHLYTQTAFLFSLLCSVLVSGPRNTVQQGGSIFQNLKLQCVVVSKC